ncbi:MAG: DUF7948 domain-containing protein [Bacteroidia bacterium]
MGNKLRQAMMLLCGMAFAHVSFAQSPVQFTRNDGQWHPNVLFEGDILSGKLFVEQQGFTYYFLHGDDYTTFHDISHHKKEFPEGFAMRYHVLRTKFIGAKPTLAEGKTPYPFYRNYFIGKDRNKWAGHVPVFNEVDYTNLYPGIDLKLYNDASGLKYDWLIAPHVDPGQITVAYDGAEDIFLDNGILYIRTSVNHLVEGVPLAYQMVGEERKSVSCSYVLEGKNIHFRVGDYNPDLPLIIDPPIMIFATYSGSSADNFGFTATYDSRGNLYAAGNVTEAYPQAPNGRYPATTGAFQVNPAGFIGTSGPYGFFQCDMAISKYDSSGKVLVWASYLGGTDNDYPHSLVVDADDRLVILGSTYSDDFPVDTLAADTMLGGGADIVVVKFSFDGSALVGSTYIGGPDDDGVLDNTALTYNFADNHRGDIQVARSGNIFFASCAKSNTGILISPDAIQTQHGGGYDGLIMELDSSLQNVMWATYWGGDKDDALYALRIDKSNNLISGGGTLSSIVTTPKAIYPNRLGGIDGMVLRIDQNNKTLLASSYIGTAKYDQVYFVDFDLKNHVYVFGQTAGTMPVVGSPYNFPGGGQFIIKMDEKLDSLLMATTLGNRTNDPNFSPTAFLVDNCYNIYFAGWGSEIGVGHVGTTTGLPVTPDALYSQTDGNDFYLGVLDKNAQNLIYATFFGGTQTADHVDGGTSRFDKRGVVYHSICGSCPESGGPYFISDIITTPGAAFPVNSSPRCSNASFKLDFQITYAVESDFVAAPRLGCSPLKVNFTNKSYQGTSFTWDFGDGSIDTGYNATHTYTQSGKFRAWLKVVDSLSCNLVDSVFVDIEVVPTIPSDFTASFKACSKQVQFNASSPAPLGYFWDFGDGTTSIQKDPLHEYTEYGTYIVRFITNKSGPCADTLEKTISLTQPAGGKLMIPNVFTPDPEDNLNTCYSFDGLENCDELEVEIYNRYAELVYESKDIHFCWNGASQKTGRLLPAGVYYVIAKVRSGGGESVDYKGTVTMIY